MTAKITAIYGPPGTGKTTYLGNEINKRVPSAYDPFDVICSSFTTAAAVALAGPDTLLDPELNIRTLHSFGYQAFGEPAPAVLGGRKQGTKPDVTDQWNEEFPYWAIRRSKHHYEGGRSQGDSLLADTSRMRNLILPLDDFSEADWLKHADYYASRAFWGEWRQFKNRHECIDFTDMIETPFRQHWPPPNGARFAVIDEVQDCVPLQVALIRQWAEEMDEVILALDDDQSIYSHLGADPSSVGDWPGIEKIHLGQSYRLSGAVHAYSQDWIGRLGDRREPKPFAPRADGYMGRVDYMPELTARYPEALVEVCSAVAKTKQTIMVLTANNYQLRPIVTALRDAGIPFHNPYRRREKSWNPLLAKDGPSSVAMALELLQDGPTTVRKLDSLRELVRPDEFLDYKTTLDTIKAKGSGEPVDPTEHLSGDFSDEMLMAKAKPGKANAIGYAARIRKSGLDPDPYVVVGTIHSVKGGEADVVILLPDLGAKQEYEADPDALTRQYYVAMTRARSDVLIGGLSYRHGMRLRPTVML